MRHRSVRRPPLDPAAVGLRWRPIFGPCSSSPAPLTPDVSALAAEPVRIDPSTEWTPLSDEPMRRIGHEGVTLVPLEVEIDADGEVSGRAKDSAFATPGSEGAQPF